MSIISAAISPSLDFAEVKKFSDPYTEKTFDELVQLHHNEGLPYYLAVLTDVYGSKYYIDALHQIYNQFKRHNGQMFLKEEINKVTIYKISKQSTLLFKYFTLYKGLNLKESEYKNINASRLKKATIVNPPNFPTLKQLCYDALSLHLEFLAFDPMYEKEKETHKVSQEITPNANFSKKDIYTNLKHKQLYRLTSAQCAKKYPTFLTLYKDQQSNSYVVEDTYSWMQQFRVITTELELLKHIQKQCRKINDFFIYINEKDNPCSYRLWCDGTAFKKAPTHYIKVINASNLRLCPEERSEEAFYAAECHFRKGEDQEAQFWFKEAEKEGWLTFHPDIAYILKNRIAATLLHDLNDDEATQEGLNYLYEAVMMAPPEEKENLEKIFEQLRDAYLENIKS